MEFNGENLKHLLTIAVRYDKNKFTGPHKQAEQLQKPVIYDQEYKNGEMIYGHHLSHFWIGIEVPEDCVPYGIRGFTFPQITIHEPKLMFATPLFVENMDNTWYLQLTLGDESAFQEYKPMPSAKLIFLEMPISFIERCKWWNFVDSDEEYTIVPKIWKIKYAKVNEINPIF